MKSAAFGCSLKHANIRRNSFLSVAMFIRCHGAQPDGGVVSRLSTFSTISAPVIHSCAVLDQILSAFVYPLRSVVTHVHLKTLASHLSLSLCYNLRAKIPSVINLTDGLELLSLRLTLMAHCDASSTILYGIITRSLLRLNHHWVKTRGAFSHKLHTTRSISKGWARSNCSKTERKLIGDIIS